MSEHGGFGDPMTSGGMAEDSAQHFRIDLNQAPQSIYDFRWAAELMRHLMDQADRLTVIPAPASDGVSGGAAKEIGQWAGNEPGALRWALDSGAMQLERTADTLEQSLVTYQNTDQANSAHLSRPEL